MRRTEEKMKNEEEGEKGVKLSLCPYLFGFSVLGLIKITFMSLLDLVNFNYNNN